MSEEKLNSLTSKKPSYTIENEQLTILQVGTERSIVRTETNKILIINNNLFDLVEENILFERGD